jgi:hypothetical protein
MKKEGATLHKKERRKENPGVSNPMIPWSKVVLAAIGQMMSGDGGDVAVNNGFKFQILHPSVHYRLLPPLPLLNPSDPYRYHHQCPSSSVSVSG